MAKRRRASTATKVIRVPAAAPRSAAPIIKVSAPRAAPARRKAPRRRRSGAVRGIVGGAINSGIDVAIGGALFGFAVKQGWVQKLPAVPLIGRTGTAAILLHFWAKRGGGEMVRKAANAAATIAGYQLGSQGSITGDGHFATAGNADPAADAYYYADGDDDDEADGDDDDE